MLLIKCPYCGQRPETEFKCGGEAHIARPENPSALNDEAWADFLYTRSSIKGVLAERWMHSHGCQRWFNALRNTHSDAFLITYEMGTPRPAVDENGELK